MSLVDREQVRDVKKLQRHLDVPLGLSRPQLPLAQHAATPAVPAVAVPTVSRTETTGTVKWFNQRKGYGFITRDGADDVFVHASSIPGVSLPSVRPGRRVAFEIGAGKRGDQARNVALV